MSTQKLSQSDFINRCISIHGTKYDYSETIYKNSTSKIKVKCNTCFTNWMVIPGNHTGIKKSGCPICKNIKHQERMDKSVILSDDFVNRCKTKHGDAYDYSDTVYVSSNKKISIICKTHGKFSQWPSDHTNGRGCPICAGVKRKTTDEFINEAKKIFPEFDFSLTDYKNAHTKIKIICPTHGVFSQKPNAILNGIGCCECSVSRMLATKIEKGDIRSVEQMSEYEAYRKAVWRISNQQYKLHKDIINPTGLPRSLAYHLDHKYSIQQGWQNKVPAEIIGGYRNLQIIEGKKNRQKGNKCEITLYQLL